ncbi:MAG TPA: MTH1187 family thiamine-binding protein [Planctomycetota bacterium]|nr:MTH1187 family thiamine-binding protein [Planctomycetota bacterium]
MVVAEFRITTAGANASMSDDIAKAVRIIDASGLRYEVHPMGTIVQGSVDEVFDLFRKCHKAVARNAERVFSTITIDDRRDRRGGRTRRSIQSKTQSVQRKLGKKPGR